MSLTDEPAEKSTPLGWAVLLLALLVSITAVWLLSELPILTAAYAGGLATLMALLIVLRNKAGSAQAEALAPPDWSVTLTAIDQPGMLVGLFLLGYGCFRFGIEYVREADAQLMEFAARTGLHMGQWLCIPMILGGLYLIATARGRRLRVEPVAGGASVA